MESVGSSLWWLWGLIVFVVWIIALVDILRNDFKGQNEKLIWVLVVVFLPLLGSLLYFLVGRSRKS